MEGRRERTAGRARDPSRRRVEIAITPTLGLSPDARECATMCALPGRAAAVLWGGASPTAHDLEELWLLQFNDDDHDPTWSMLEPKPDGFQPTGRSGHSAVIVVPCAAGLDTRMRIFGGFNSASRRFLADVADYNLDTAEWEQLQLLGEGKPSARRGHGAVWCDPGPGHGPGEMFVYGGLGLDGPLDDLYRLRCVQTAAGGGDGTASPRWQWSRVDLSVGPSRPPALYDGAMVCCRASEGPLRLHLVGGSLQDGQPAGAVWELELHGEGGDAQGRRLSPGLSPRARHSTALLGAWRGWLAIMGGCAESPNAFAEPPIQLLDLVSERWVDLELEETRLDGTPSPRLTEPDVLYAFSPGSVSRRRDFCMCAVEAGTAELLLIWGGRDSDGYCNSGLWKVDGLLTGTEADAKSRGLLPPSAVSSMDTNPRSTPDNDLHMLLHSGEFSNESDASDSGASSGAEEHGGLVGYAGGAGEPPLSPLGRLASEDDGDPRSWKKGKLLGHGAYGRVYSCLDSDTGQFFAVKEIEITQRRVQVEKLITEVQMLKRYRHRNIVGFLGCSIDADGAMLHILMEICPGGDLRTTLQQYGPLPAAVASRYSNQICTGLGYLHNCNVIHRDIKGANCLLTVDGELKLADFGLARTILAGDAESAVSSAGSPFWMAPEVVQGVNVTSRSDVWSFGATVFEMAAGKPPFATMEPTAALFYIGTRGKLDCDPPELLGAAGMDFVRRCMQTAPQARPSCEELALHPFIAAP